ncbi:hypothetical protein [Cerasicoccus frondis]|uniref:hypothetical protein n=1 Tax=Cerasicoccus frondis TaxID=490090 RepID=UPI002852648C|nr:hypothetical protein [Cerasicoccus frondis]
MSLTPKAKRILIISGVLLALLIVATPFTWRFVKQKRAENLAEDAKVLLEEERYGAAWEAAKAAYALDPDNTEVARTLAGILNDADPQGAPALWQKVYEQTKEEADLLAWFDSTTRLQDEAAIKALAQRLAQDFPNSAEALYRRARVELVNNRPAKAVELARQAAAAPDSPIEIQFAYINLSLQSDNEATRQAGLQWLQDMAKRKDEIGLEAARAMLTAPDMTHEQLLVAAENLARHPLAGREDQLTEIVVRRRLGTHTMDELLDEVQEMFNLEDPSELVEIGRWLNQQGRPEDFLKLVNFDMAISRRDLFLVWVDSMAYTKQWDELARIVERPRLPLDPFTIVLFRSRIQEELGNDRISNLIWGQALVTAKEDIGKLEFAYTYATKMGWPERAREVLEKLALIPATQRKAFEEMIKLDQDSGDIHALHHALERMAEKYPNDSDVANDIAYLNLLLGGDIQESVTTANRLLQESERPYLANIITLSLGLYLAGNEQLALEQLYTLPIDWSEARPRHRAIYATILAANGHQNESQSVMEGVNPDDLLPEERELLREARL